MRAPDLNPARWPVAVRVPLLVVLLLLAVSAVITHAVLARLTVIQQRQLGSLTSVYLDGLSAAVLPNVLTDDTWQVFDALDRMSGFDKELGPAIVTVANLSGRIIASSAPRQFHTDAPIPDDLHRAFENQADLVVDEVAARADVRRRLVYHDRPVGTLYARVGIGSLLQERREILLALLATNGALVLLLTLLGFLAARRMMAPVRILSAHLNHGAVGSVQSIPVETVRRQNREFARLFQRFNAMASAVTEREALALHLAAEERLSGLGRLASSMAHEINNPLGGLFNALDTLRRHGGDPGVREQALSLLERGLAHIRNVVRSALVTYRPERAESEALNPADIDDLRLLIEPEAMRKALFLEWNNQITGQLPVPAGKIRQVLLNLLLNACTVSPVRGRVQLHADRDETWLRLKVGDQADGLTPVLTEYITGRLDTMPAGNGLGLWIVRRLVAEAGGAIRVGADGPFTTTIEVRWPLPSGGKMVRFPNGKVRSEEVSDYVA